MNQDLIDDVCDIAIKAGEAIMKIYNGDGDFGVESKSDDSPLTKADKASNDVINAGLLNLSVLYPIVSEENTNVEYDDRKDYPRFWMVDPLDGTKEFIKKNGEFTVNIALIEDEYPIMGVVYTPATGILHYASKGNGAFRKEGDHVKQIECRDFDINSEGLNVVTSRSHLNDATQAFLEKLNSPKTVPTGSSLKLLIMAEGEADIYPRLGPTMEWDIAAVQIILEEAGGRVVQHDNLERLKYNKESLLNPYFIAAGRTDGPVLI